MKLFEAFLLTSDYDHTMTDREGNIPARNLEAIRYFIDNGGTFTMNTGRSQVTSQQVFRQIPTNAPLILHNGSTMYDAGRFVQIHPISVDPWEILNTLSSRYPEIKLEVHGLEKHYILDMQPEDAAYYECNRWAYQAVKPGDDLGPFVKFNVQAKRQQKDAAPEKTVRKDKDPAFYDEIQAFIETRWAGKLEVFRSFPTLLNVHAKGVSKLSGARQLQKQLGKKYLVCVGDEGNDIAMLDGADYAYCPADGAVADRYETVCSSGEGAVADVIYKKIPEILKNQP